jgi:hypothetical protein
MHTTCTRAFRVTNGSLESARFAIFGMFFHTPFELNCMRSMAFKNDVENLRFRDLLKGKPPTMQPAPLLK